MKNQEWMPIETAPKDGTRILVGGDGQVTIGYWIEVKGRTLVAADRPYWEEYDNSYWNTDGDDWFLITHWMSLPPPPNEGEK